MSFRRKRPVQLQAGPEWTSPLKEESPTESQEEETDTQSSYNLLSVLSRTMSNENDKDAKIRPMTELSDNVTERSPLKKCKRETAKTVDKCDTVIVAPNTDKAEDDVVVISDDDEDEPVVQQLPHKPLRKGIKSVAANDIQSKVSTSPQVMCSPASKSPAGEIGLESAPTLSLAPDSCVVPSPGRDTGCEENDPTCKTGDDTEAPVPASTAESDDDGDADEEDCLSQADIDRNNEVRQRNIKAMLSGKISLKRTSLFACCMIPESLQKPFVPPPQSAIPKAAPLLPNNGRRRTLGIRRRRRSSLDNGGGSVFRVQLIPTPLTEEVDLTDFDADAGSVTKNPSGMPPGPTKWERLVVWRGDGCQCPGAAAGDHNDSCSAPLVEVPDILCRWLRPHQREGVKFMYECVSGMRSFEGRGCILADDMGLGKTLQSITLMYTMMHGGKEQPGTPDVKKCIVVTPTSLVGNWSEELEKWVPNRVEHIALSDSSKEKVLRGIRNFLAVERIRTLVISYETFRRYVDLFMTKADECCDLLILDEAHRLKNNATATSMALSSLPCRRRVLLSGTPLQNDLEEFFAIVNFTNPDILGTQARFRKYYQSPILHGREPDCTDGEEELGKKRSEEMSEIVNHFILRRSNELNRKHLPEKIVNVVCIKLTELQKQVYNHLLTEKEISWQRDGTQSKSLLSINALKKLCNHPKLVYDDIRAAETNGKLEQAAHGFQNCRHLFPADFSARQRGRANQARVELAGKMDVLAQMLWKLRHEKKERIVIVSNYTQTLDIIALLCRENRYPFVRLDGSTGVKKRQKLVNRFNGKEDVFVFLLSSKAGGCGLNLIGGSRLILFDPDWNPATDKQAAARIWRDGQKRTCYIYRFLATGTIEEKIFERQISKEGLSQIVMEGGAKGAAMSSDDLREIFTYNENCISDTHDSLGCRRCRYRLTDGERPKHEIEQVESSQEETEDNDSIEEASQKRDEEEDVDEDDSDENDDDSDENNDDSDEDDDDSDEDDDDDADSDDEDEDSDSESADDDDVIVLDGPEEKSAVQKSRPKSGAKSKKKKKKKKKHRRCHEIVDNKPMMSADGTPMTQLQRSAQVGNPSEDEIALWAHHAQKDTIIDDVLRDSDCNSNISFVFELRVPPMVLPVGK